MIRGHYSVTKEQILELVSEDELFRKYSPNFVKQDEFFKSEFRKEVNPSCKITDFGGFLLYKDFGSPDKGVNIWGYIMRKYHVSYRDALDIVASDFGLVNKVNQSHVIQTSGESLEKSLGKRTILQIKRRNWLIKDKNYWYENYGINKDLLEDFNVHPITDYWVNSIHCHSADRSYSYDYYYHNGRLLRKIYQPLSKTKWISNIDNTVVQGIANIPKHHELLIITKSLKDIMCLRNMGYYSVAPNNEASWIPELVWQKFLGRYKQMVIFFDNDDAGVSNAQRFSNQFELPYFYLPQEENVKDISDYVRKYGMDKSINLMKQLV
jgi:hypothetical protein